MINVKHSSPYVIIHLFKVVLRGLLRILQVLLSLDLVPELVHAVFYYLVCSLVQVQSLISFSTACHFTRRLYTM